MVHPYSNNKNLKKEQAMYDEYSTSKNFESLFSIFIILWEGFEFWS